MHLFWVYTEEWNCWVWASVSILAHATAIEHRRLGGLPVTEIYFS